MFSFNPIFSVRLKNCDGGNKRTKALKNALKKETNMIKCRREVPIVGGTLLKTLTVLAYLSISSTSSQALAQNQNQGWDAQQTLDDKSFVHPPNDISEAVRIYRDYLDKYNDGEYISTINLKISKIEKFSADFLEILLSYPGVFLDLLEPYSLSLIHI